MKGKREGQREPMNTTEKVLILLGTFLVAFIVAMIVTFWARGSVPDTLIQCVLGGSGVEALALAGIKISKVISGGTGGKGDSDELAD